MSSLSTLHGDIQLAKCSNKPVGKVTLKLLRLKPVGKPEVQFLDEMTEELPHFLHSDILPNAVRRAEGERYPCIRIVYDLLRVLLHAFRNEPSVGPEYFGVGEITRVAL